MTHPLIIKRRKQAAARRKKLAPIYQLISIVLGGVAGTSIALWIIRTFM